jgi:hypothetical protein
VEGIVLPAQSGQPRAESGRAYHPRQHIAHIPPARPALTGWTGGQARSDIEAIGPGREAAS